VAGKLNVSGGVPFTHADTIRARDAASDSPTPAPNQLMEEFLAKASRTSPISKYIETPCFSSFYIFYTVCDKFRTEHMLHSFMRKL
jgi:hypothetical protein